MRRPSVTPPVAMTKRKGECHMSWTMMPAPEIRPLQFDFLFLSQCHSPLSTPPLHFSLLSFLSRPGQDKIIIRHWRYASVNPYLSHLNSHWNSNLVLLYLFSSVIITSTATKRTPISTISLNDSSLISFFCL